MATNPIMHFEIVGPDGLKLQSFYGDLFGWPIQNNPEFGNYGLVDPSATGVGGGIGGSEDGASMVTVYAEVDNPTAYLEKVVSLGGEIVMPETDIGMVVIAMFKDPAGNTIGLIKAGSSQTRPQ